MLEIDTAVLAARMDPNVHVIVHPRRRGEVLLRRREHRHAQGRRSRVQVLLLPSRQRDADPTGADTEAGDRGAQRSHRRRRARGRDGGRHPHRTTGWRQARSARGRARRAARHRWNAATGAAGGKGARDRADGDRPPDVLRRGARARHRHRGLGRRAAEGRSFARAVHEYAQQLHAAATRRARRSAG